MERLEDEIFLFSTTLTNKTKIFLRAEADLKNHTSVVETWADFLKGLDKKNIIMAPFCGQKDCEEKIKKDSARLFELVYCYCYCYFIFN